MQTLILIENIVSKIFKRNRVPLEIKILAIALFLHGLGMERISKIINKAKSSVHYWTSKFREALDYIPKRKERKCIAIDETKIRVNNTWYFIICSYRYRNKRIDLHEGIHIKELSNHTRFCQTGS